MDPIGDEAESRRTNALALWRYGHDYLRAAQSLCETDRVTCNEAQAVYHVAAQGIEFALKSFLRARGVPPEVLNARLRHSLADALREALARGLPAPPAEVERAIRFIAPHHQDDRFAYLEAEAGAFPDLAPLIAAGTWILRQIAAEVVADYRTRYGRADGAGGDDMVRRLHIDLDLTAGRAAPLQ